MAAQRFRTAADGDIDRNKTIRFSFDGKIYEGCDGDTLASALMANGVRVLGRSFKYHRPRGLFAMGPEEPNALVTVRQGARREPNIPATMVEIFDGLVAESQNHWPSLGFDLTRVNDLLSSVSGIGFLLQDVHVAGLVLGAGLRTSDPQSGRHGGGSRSTGPRPL